MALCHLQENLEINMVKKIMNTATKTGINAVKKIGDKYGKNLMDTENEINEVEEIYISPERRQQIIGD